MTNMRSYRGKHCRSVAISKDGGQATYRGLLKVAKGAVNANGFFDQFTKELPMEYAVELNRLITLQMEGSIG